MLVEPKISVIVPVYNVEKYLRRCLDSIVNQTLKEIEIIVVNDASPDNSQKIIDEYAAKDSRIIPILHLENKGLGGARNTGIRMASAEWLLFLDSDDYIHLNTVEIFLEKVAKYPRIECFMCQFIQVYKDGTIGPCSNNNLAKDKMIENPWKHCSYGIYICACAKLWKRRLFTANNIYFPENIYFEDFPTTPRLLYLLSYVLVLPDKLYFYFRRETSITNTYSDYHILSQAQAFTLLFDWGKRELVNQDFDHLLHICKDTLEYFLLEYASIGLESFPSNEREGEVLRRYQLLLKESNLTIIAFVLRHLVIENAAMKANSWYRFSQLSRKRKIWAIGKSISQKLGVYKLLRPLFRNMHFT